MFIKCMLARITKIMKGLFLLSVFCLNIPVWGYALATEKTSVPWVMDIVPSQSQWKSEDARARVVIFRLTRPDDNYALPLNIFVNEQYLSSLYPEHQAIGFSLCPGKSSFNVMPINSNNNAVDSLQKSGVLTPELQAGSVYFYQVAMDDEGRVLARWVDGEQAKSVLENIRIQTHTISRVNEGDKCPSSIYTLNASSLFRLAEYEESGLLPDSIEKLKELADTINSEYKSITKVIVNGYADPMGDDISNQQLSELRANTIMSQIVSSGVSPTIISARGHGESSLLVSDCDKYKKREQIIECNQPNRRVEVEVYGIKRE